MNLEYIFLSSKMGFLQFLINIFLFSGKNEGTMVINPKVIHQSNSRPKSEGKNLVLSKVFSELSNSFIFQKNFGLYNPLKFKVIEQVEYLFHWYTFLFLTQYFEFPARFTTFFVYLLDKIRR